MQLLVGTDFSESADNALRYAAELAIKSNGEIIVAHVFQSMSPTGKMGLNSKIREDAESEMKTTLDELKIAYPSLKKVKSSIIKGEAHNKLEVLFKREKLDLLIIGTKGEANESSIFLGNVAGKFIRLADMPMLMIPTASRFKNINKIVFAIKRTKINQKKTVAPLKKILSLFGARLTILHVNTDIKKMKIGSRLSKLANNLITIESDRFYKPIEKFVESGNFGMLCVIRRKRGFFHKFLISKSFSTAKFSTTLPMLILQGQKD